MELPKVPPFDLSRLNPLECRRINQLHRASIVVVSSALEMIPVKLPGLDYHTRRHSEKDVTHGFIGLGISAVNRGKMTIEDFYIGLTAAGTHDLYYDKELIGTGENETRSTEETLKLMQEHGIFTEDNEENVAKLHSATVFKVAGKDGIVQSATEGNFLEELITDVDTGGIGMPWIEAKDRIDNYYRELKGKEPSETDPDYIDFLHFQVDVLTGHSYKTPEAREKYRHLESNAEKIKKLINKLTR